MHSIKVVLSNRFSTLVVATALLQGAVLLSGTFFKLSLPRYAVALPSFSSSESHENGTTAAASGEDDEALASLSLPLLSEDAQEGANEESSQRLGARVVVHTVRAGDTLSRIWERYTGKTTGAIQAAAAFKAVKIPLNALKKGEAIELQISDRGDITGVRKKLDKGRTLLLEGDSSKGYQATVTESKIGEVTKTITGSIYSSLAADASGAGVPAEVIDSLADLLGGKIEFRKDLQPGDTFSVSYTERSTEEGEAIGYGQVMRASVVTGGKLYAAIAYKGKDGKIRYYDNEGNALGGFFLRYPLRFTRISSVFSDARLHPILGVKRPHPGIDFAAPHGTPVRAVGSGVVTFAGYSGQAGNMITIKHNAKYATAYLHLSGVRKGLKKSSTIARGDIIGYVGSTGLSTGPHLDFRLSVSGKYVNPLNANLPQIADGGESIPKTVLTAALRELNQAHQLQRMIAALRDGVRGLS